MVSIDRFRQFVLIKYNCAVGSWIGRPLLSRERWERKVRTPKSGVPDNVREAGVKASRRKVPQKIYRLAVVGRWPFVVDLWQVGRQNLLFANFFAHATNRERLITAG